MALRVRSSFRAEKIYKVWTVSLPWGVPTRQSMKQKWATVCIDIQEYSMGPHIQIIYSPVPEQRSPRSTI